jgi:RNA polymerase sigma-70 factor, ECF subfamily
MTRPQEDRPPLTAEQAPASDASLLRRYRRGEQDAATELYLRYAGRLRILADTRASPELKQRVDPEDIVQSVFRTFFRRADVGQYDAPTGDELWKLFLVIGLNKIRKVAAFHKAAKRDVRQTAVGTGYDQAVALTPGTDEEALHTLQMTIEELLAPLPDSHRAIIDLRAAGHEVADIAGRTGRSRRSVERILHDFRRRLHELLHDPD